VTTSQHISVFARLDRWWTDRAPRGEFWALAGAALLFTLGVSVFFFLYNLFLLDLGFRERSLGLLASSMALGSMAGTLPMGIAAQRFGLKRVLITCLLLMAAASSARVFLLWFPSQMAFAFFDGAMLCGWVVCLAPAVADVVEERKRPFAFSVLFSISVASGSLGGLIGGHLPELFQGLAARVLSTSLSVVNANKATLLTASILTALAAWPISRLRSASPAPVSGPSILLPSPFVVRFLVAGGCWAAVLGAFNPFTNVFFSRYLGVATAQLGNFFSVAQLVQAGAVLLMPFLLRRTGLISGILAVQLATAGAIGLMAIGRGVLQEEILYCTFMAAQHMCEPGMQSLLMDQVAAERRSAAAAMYFLVISIAQAASAAVAGAAFARYSYPTVLAAISVATVAAAVGFRILCAPRYWAKPNQ
jgi:MFS family permease